MRWLLAPYADRRTYTILLYLLLGLPVGVFDFMLVITGLSLGLGTIITLLGIPILVATLLVVQALAILEGRLAQALLEAPMPHVPALHEEPHGVFWARLRSLVTSRRTWTELAFLLLRFPIGIFGFVVATTIVGLMVVGFVEPILVAAGVNSDIGPWTIDTFGESLIYLPVSVLFLLVGPRLVVAFGQVSARFATAMLGVVEPAELKRAIGVVLTRAGRADAFQIMDELELRLGRGPFLTPTRLEAALIALESNGLVTALREGPRTVYARA